MRPKRTLQRFSSWHAIGHLDVELRSGAGGQRRGIGLRQAALGHQAGFVLMRHRHLPPATFRLSRPAYTTTWSGLDALVQAFQCTNCWTCASISPVRSLLMLSGSRTADPWLTSSFRADHLHCTPSAKASTHGWAGLLERTPAGAAVVPVTPLAGGGQLPARPWRGPAPGRSGYPTTILLLPHPAAHCRLHIGVTSSRELDVWKGSSSKTIFFPGTCVL